MNGIGGERELLAQIETRRKLADSLLASWDLVRLGRMQQPVGERVLSGCARCLRDQFIQATAAEDVEVARVKMRGIEKTHACVAMSCPLIIQARQTAPIEALEASGGCERSEKTLVRDPQDHEDERWARAPRRGGSDIDEPARGQRQPPL